MADLDIWMPLYIGKYLAATAHLEALESGACLHLLMHSWMNGPLPTNPELLRRIAKVPHDAWSNAWELLKPLFTETEAGFIQKGQEEIRAEWAGKKVKAKEKATNAANARWGHAPSNASSMPEAKPEALLEDCPLSLSLTTSKKKVQKPSRDKREPDPRHVPFREACEAYANFKRVTFAWDASEAKQLSLILAAAPELTLETFQACLNNRARSPAVIHSDRPRVWLANILSFEHSAKNQFNQPEGTSNGTFKGKTAQSIDAARQAIAIISARAQVERDREDADATWSASAGEAGSGGLLALRSGS